MNTISFVKALEKFESQDLHYDELFKAYNRWHDSGMPGLTPDLHRRTGKALKLARRDFIIEDTNVTFMIEIMEENGFGTIGEAVLLMEKDKEYYKKIIKQRTDNALAKEGLVDVVH